MFKRRLGSFLITFALLSTANTVYAGEVWRAHVDYTSQYSTYSTLREDATLVVLATVKEKEAKYFMGDSGIIFTHYPVEVIEVLENPNNYPTDDICVSFTGGEVEGGDTLIVEETPTLEVGKTYLFVVKKTYPEREDDNDYTPCGAYQGVFETTIPEVQTLDADAELDLSQYEISALNQYCNTIEAELIGKKLDEMKDYTK